MAIKRINFLIEPKSAKTVDVYIMWNDTKEDGNGWRSEQFLMDYDMRGLPAQKIMVDICKLIAEQLYR